MAVAGTVADPFASGKPFMSGWEAAWCVYNRGSGFAIRDPGFGPSTG